VSVAADAVCLVVEAADPHVAVGILVVDEGGGDGHALGLLVGDDDLFHIAHPFLSAPGAGLAAANLENICVAPFGVRSQDATCRNSAQATK
jgi:hypothetical protein